MCAVFGRVTFCSRLLRCLPGPPGSQVHCPPWKSRGPGGRVHWPPRGQGPPEGPPEGQGAPLKARAPLKALPYENPVCVPGLDGAHWAACLLTVGPLGRLMILTIFYPLAIFFGFFRFFIFSFFCFYFLSTFFIFFCREGPLVIGGGHLPPAPLWCRPWRSR